MHESRLRESGHYQLLHPFGLNTTPHTLAEAAAA